MSADDPFRGRKVPNIRDEVARLLERGWTMEKGGSGHLKLRHPVRGMVTVSLSPTSERRTLQNLRSHVRRVEADQ